MCKPKNLEISVIINSCLLFFIFVFVLIYKGIQVTSLVLHFAVGAVLSPISF